MRRTYLKMILLLYVVLMLFMLPALAENIPEAPQFSEPGGFYNEAVSLEITSPDGYEIRYTTDATDPSVSTSAYQLPLTIENTDAQPNGISSRCDITLESYTPPCIRCRNARSSALYAYRRTEP